MTSVIVSCLGISFHPQNLCNITYNFRYHKSRNTQKYTPFLFVSRNTRHSCPYLETHTISVHAEAQTAVIEYKTRDTCIALNQDGSFKNCDLLTRLLGLVHITYALDEGLVQFVNVVCDGFTLLGVIQQRMMGQGQLGETVAPRVPSLSKG